jgi:hypothetical protein
VFFVDQRAGSSVGVTPPKEWHLEYLDESRQWKKVNAEYGSRVSDNPEDVRFKEVVNAKSVRRFSNINY